MTLILNKYIANIDKNLLFINKCIFYLKFFIQYSGFNFANSYYYQKINFFRVKLKVALRLLINSLVYCAVGSKSGSKIVISRPVSFLL